MSWTPTSVDTVNILVLGGPGSGKSSLLFSYDRGVFLNTALPTELHVERTISRGKRTQTLNIIDGGPVSRILEVGPSLMPSVDLIILCYDVSDRGSMTTALNVLNYVELHSEDCLCCPCSTRSVLRPKLVVVGTKADLRFNQDLLFELFDSQKSMVSPLEGREFAQSVRADLYWETSALFHEGVDELFYEIFTLFNPGLLKRFRELTVKLSRSALVLVS
eukprot:sb/3469879/